MIGADDASMMTASHAVAEMGGGLVVAQGETVIARLPLPIGGIVSDIEPDEMARKEQELDDAARALGCALAWPFMYMFVLQITAIPDFAMTDLGVIDCVDLKVVDPLKMAS